ncbi:hypothetical protein H8E07_09735 [bacterium]|nr:hypothetical protein [bacterium]
MDKLTDDERAELKRYRTWAPVAERLLKDERDARKQAEAERDMERREVGKLRGMLEEQANALRGHMAKQDGAKVPGAV